MSYVLITPVKNEEAYIEETLASVVAQTERPEEWVVVSDGSTDRTDAIIQPYADAHPFINFVRNTNTAGRDFASQVYTMNIGCEALKTTAYDLIGFLDGDIRLDPSYYETMLARVKEDEALGIVGGAFHQKIGDRFIDQKVSEDSVAGGVQLFRRACYEAIGGFIPMSMGGFDAIAEVMARMHGWKTQTFSDTPFYHLKPLNAGTGNCFAGQWQMGQRDYLIGNHPLFQLFRCAYRAREKPIVLSAVIRLAGFLWALLKRSNRPIPRDVVAYKQDEQIQRLKAMFSRQRNG